MDTRRSSTPSDGASPAIEKGNLTHHVETEPAVESTFSIDPDEERRLVRKIDWWVLPPIMLLYLNSFIDRVNIGNARLYDMEADLGMEGNDFQLAVSLLFITYVLGELPSNLIIKHYVRPSRWIAFITLAWGFTATFSAFVTNLNELIACRLLLGLFEAGLFPGCVIYLTYFYTKRELAMRTAWLFVNAAIAGALGGLLAFGIGYMHGIGGWSGWRWILAIEGIPTVIMGFAVWFWLADDADTAYFLTPREREVVLLRRKAQLGHTEVFDWVDARKGLIDWKTYAFSIPHFANLVCLYSFSSFAPTIIRGVMPDASRAEVQLLTMPCYVWGAGCYLVAAWYSDRIQVRGPIVFGTGMCTVAGYIILVTPTPAGAKYFGTIFATTGMYAILGIAIAWLNTQNPRYGKRTAASGTQIMIGNVSGIVAPWVYPTASGPEFIAGHSAVAGCVAFGCTSFLLMSYYLKWENAQRRAGKRDHRLEGLNEEEAAKLGDKHPRFEYTI